MEDYLDITKILNRDPNLLELGIFSVMWSEHCSYKSSKIHLAKLPTKAPWVVQGPGENAGVIDIGDGYVAIFKMESHNHPSFIEPYQGAATGVGGILRDIFTMGARPVALLNSLRFGDQKLARTRYLIDGVVRGIAGYGNCVGVPTVGGECSFHPAYNGNNLVNVMCVGIAQKEKVFYAKASGHGNPVGYFGARTGRDGIHGATMASAEFGEETQSSRPTVQVGDPLTGKLLIEACLELMEKDCIVAIQDMGAAGLTSSSFEMAAKGDCGIELDLDQVPCREEAMSAYEIMLSESQERMLVVLKEGREHEARAIMEKWDLSYATIGKVTDTGRMVIKKDGKLAASVPIPPVSGASPVLERPYQEAQPHTPVYVSDLLNYGSLSDVLKGLAANPDLVSKRWIYEQYDSMVQADTLAGPGGDAAIVRVHGTKRALALTSDCNPRYVFADPFTGGKQAVAEAYRNLCAVGAKPLAITNCLNFGSPERSDIMGQFVGAVEGMAEASKLLEFPVVSGNVSLYNETAGQAILPTPTIGGVGILEDYKKSSGIALYEEGLCLLLIGETTGWMGSSLFWRYIVQRAEGAPPPVYLKSEKLHGTCVRDLIQQGLIRACHDLSDGGLAIAALEMALAGKVGVELTAPRAAYSNYGWFFGEDQGRYLLAVSKSDLKEVLDFCHRRGILVRETGHTIASGFKLGDEEVLDLGELRQIHETSFERMMDDLSSSGA